MTRVRRGALAGIFALALAVAGLLAAAVASGARPLSVLTTTGTTGATTTTPAPSIAAGVTIGGVPVGGLTAADAYDAVNESFSQPLVIIVAAHRLAPQPANLGAVARIGEAVARAGSALPGAQVPLAVSVNRARVRAYVGVLAKRFDAQPVDARLFLRNLRPWIAKPVVGLAIYRARAEVAIVSALLGNKRGPLRLRQKVVPPTTTPIRSLPNSRAIRATTTIVATVLSVDSTRSPITVSPKTAVEIRAMNGVSGGWSTYPHEMCRPNSRK